MAKPRVRLGEPSSYNRDDSACELRARLGEPSSHDPGDPARVAGTETRDVSGRRTRFAGWRRAMIWPWALPRDRMTWPGAPPAPVWRSRASSRAVRAARGVDPGHRAVGAARKREDGPAPVLDRQAGAGGPCRVGSGGTRRAGSAAVLAIGARRAKADGPGVEAGAGAHGGAGPGRLGGRGAAAERPGPAGGPALAGGRRRARVGLGRRAAPAGAAAYRAG
jgi:hypothetical protein